MKNNFLRRVSAGFTLIELLVSIAIGLFLIAVVGGVYLSSKDSFNYQDAMSRLQENSRFAMELLARDIRMAGFSSCGSLGKVTNTVNNSSSNPLINISIPIFGLDNLLAPTTETPSAALNSDSISLIGFESSDGCSPSSPLFVTSHNAIAASIHTNKTHCYPKGSLLVATNCAVSAVFQMSNVNNNNTVSIIDHNTGTGTPGNCQKELGSSCGSATPVRLDLDEDSPPPTQIGRLSSNTYYIRPSATPIPNDGNALWKCSPSLIAAPDCTELVNGVEDMQIEYGVDTDGDQSANQYVTANNVGNWSQVVSVRISLLMATPPSAGRLSSKDSQTYTYNGTTITASDRRVRHVLQQHGERAQQDQVRWK